MAPGRRGGGAGGKKEDERDYSDANDAKELFDLIGETVRKKVRDAALKDGNNKLLGHLSSAIFTDGAITPSGPCDLDYKVHTNVTSTVIDPCKHDSEKRFSDTKGAECDRKKIKDNKINSGTCAPFRRLSLCDTNLEHIQPHQIDNTHNFLVDVCMAAKYEGTSLKGYHDKYKIHNPDSQLCTVLARSFADIGDIVRGRDLYFGNSKEKNRRENLENNLKEIFKNIYDDLTKDNDNAALKTRYQHDAPDYYQLREDWWEENRQQVWKALTCDAGGGTYFRFTCSNDTTLAHKNCTCISGDPPTYFDYVPQYLRWFEEWGEDFCRKKKKKLENAKKKCRGQYQGADRYCSRNGYDCEKTISRIGKVRMGKGCTDCFFACNPYIDWINNQKEQFDKQVKKYGTEISGGGSAGGSRKKRNTRGGSNYDGYEKKFYDELKKHGYETVDAFLGLLNNEKACQAVKDSEGGKINFKEVNSGSTNGDGSGDSGTNDKTKGTFYHSQYCQVCPDCGVKRNGSGWEEKDKSKEKCDGQILYKPKGGAIPTDITILKSGEGHDDIEKKLKEFCLTQNSSDGSVGSVVTTGVSGGNSDSSLYEKWKCYKEDDIEKHGDDDDDDDDDDGNPLKAGGLCILKNDKNKEEKKENKSSKEPADSQKTFHDFFTYWVAHMLKDSIYWRKKLKKFLENEKKKCGKEKYNKQCDCFQKWVKQKKEEEWTPIKTHFYKQKNLGEDAGFINFSPYYILEENLKLQFLKKDSEDSAEDSQSRDEDAEEMKHLKKILKLENENTLAVVNAGTEENTTIDKLLEQELKDAEQCKKCEEPQQPADKGADRAITTPQPPVESDSESEDEGDDDDVSHVDEEEAAEEVEETVVPVPSQEDDVNVCETVKNALEGDLSEACTLKYVTGKNYGWKCVNTTSDKGSEATARGPSHVARSAEPTRDGVATTGSGKDGATGGLCVPPRRRKLYVTPLTKWAEKQVGNTQVATQPQDQTPSQSDKLRTAFIESAAVETFFAWHKYKEQWKAQNTSSLSGVGDLFGGGAVHGMSAVSGLGGVPSFGAMPQGDVESIQLQVPDGAIGSDPDPQTQLKSGNIPPDFLRLMFYTLGDYRDILFSGSKDEKSGDTDIFSGDKEITDREKTIKGAISSYFSNSGNVQAAAEKKSPDVQTPQTWWEANAKHIWEGMVCALTYKENGDKKIEQVKTADNGNLFDKLKTQYGEWNKVVLKEDDVSGPKDTKATASGDTPRLSDFIKRPPYFRYLEEWGQNFCRERTKRLEKIKEDCVKDDKQKYSGDGEECEEILPKNDGTVRDLEGSSCANSCRFYKRWIKRKKQEYEKQKEEYNNQKDKYTNKNESAEGNSGIYDQNFVGKLRKDYKSIGLFLNSLKSGPCKTNNDDDNNGEGTLDFNNQGRTFQHTEYCDPCSKFKIKCENGYCSGDTKGKCKQNGNDFISPEDIKKEGGSTEDIVMLVNDDDTKKFDGLEACQTSGIFTGIRKNVWTCCNVCGYVVCKPVKVNGPNDGTYIIQIRALIKRWLEYLFEDYNRIRKKLNHCMNSSEQTICTNGCVEQWINQKRTEWEDIKKRFNEQYNAVDPEVRSSVRGFLVDLIRQIAPTIDKGNHKRLQKLVKSLKCNCTDNSEQEGDEKDIIECLLDKLQNEITSCPTPASDHTQTACVDSPPVEDEDDALHEETEVKRPEICKDVVKTEPETDVEDSKCDKLDEDEKEEEKDKGDEEEEGASDGSSTEESKELPVPAPAGDKKEDPSPKVNPPPKRRIPRQPKKSPLPEILGASAFPWTVGIAFAALSYFVLKKKTKSTIDLLRVINIPKGDYDIPTLKSSNRYIPYASDRYKGKTYIYMEGDSGDEKYIGNISSSDITSSESEYEELDINDIYPYKSPKYKTLIDVVLEPSKRDIQSDDTPTNKFTDNEWNVLKNDFITNILQSEQNDIPNNNISANIPLNTHLNTLYFDNPQEKPFITKIHDRNLYSGEEISYNINMTNNDDIPISGKNDTYSGIDIINDSLNSDQYIDIYDEVLKRKENELFGTNHTKKNTSTNSVAKNTNSDPILNQINLFHKWLDRHRNICEEWDKNKEDILNKLKEEWNKENNNNVDKTCNSDNKPSHNYVLNTDVSIQIDMDNPKTKNEITNMDTNPDKSTMDTILDDLEKYNEPYYYEFYEDDIIYHDVDVEKSSMDDIYVDHNNVTSNNIDVPTKMHIEMNIVNNKNEIFEEEYPISDIWNI
ncbi:erythrocyte membrane protein 1, PfEMP1, putative [Plasmodium sp. gorilla clade G1]|nr:erythrocyte membrane protein 1, PfEMP1, putative [Plasmodium sp. gorilla clade G1]